MANGKRMQKELYWDSFEALDAGSKWPMKGCMKLDNDAASTQKEEE